MGYTPVIRTDESKKCEIRKVRLNDFIILKTAFPELNKNTAE